MPTSPREAANRTAKAARIWEFLRTNAPQHANPDVLANCGPDDIARMCELAGENTASAATWACVIKLAEASVNLPADPFASLPRF